MDIRKISAIIAIALMIGILCIPIIQMTPVMAQVDDGDVTIIVQDQGGNPIEGATVYALFWTPGHAVDGYMTGTTGSDGSYTFTQSDIQTFLTDNGATSDVQYYVQTNAKYISETAAGSVRTVDADDDLPCVLYNTPGGSWAFKPAMDFTYTMVMVEKEPVQTRWHEGEFTVTYRLEEVPAGFPLVRMKLFRYPWRTIDGEENKEWIWGVPEPDQHNVWALLGSSIGTISDESVSAEFSNTLLENNEEGDVMAVSLDIEYTPAASFSEYETRDGDAVDDYYFLGLTEDNPYSYIGEGSFGETATGTGEASFGPNLGVLGSLVAVDPATLPPPPEGVDFPHGLFSFDVTGLPTGGGYPATVTITITLPSAVPSGVKWYKYDAVGGWMILPVGSDDGDNVITISITDNGLGDFDPTPGVISDPGGPGLRELSVTPVKGPTGIYVNVAGTLTPSSKMDIIFYASDAEWYLVVDDTVTGPDGTLSTGFTIPDVDPGLYEIRAYLDGRIPPQDPEASTGFEVTPQPSITLVPRKGLPGITVTVNGENFPPNAIIEIKWDDVVVENTAADDGGFFTCGFTVPEDAEPGKHTVEADDTTYGTYGAAIFRVDELMIGPRSDEYLPGDVVSFYVNSTFLFNLKVEVFDPHGIPFYGFDVASDEWVRIDGRWIAPYVAQEPLIARRLPNDAPQGNWVWNATNLDTGLEVASGTFLVKEPQTFGTIIDKLNELGVKIDAIITTTEDTYAFLETMNGTMIVKLNEILEFLEDVNGTVTDIGEDVVTIQTNQGTILVAVEAIQSLLEEVNATVTDIKEGVVTIQTDVGEIRVAIEALDLDELNANIGDVVSGMAIIETAVGNIGVDIETLIGFTENINAMVEGIEGNVALIRTDIGLLSANISALDAKIMGIEGSVVEIETIVGTFEASVEVLNATVTQIRNDMATIKTTLGELEGTILDIEGDVATVLVPGIGTLQADIAELSDTVSTGIGGLGGLSSTILLIVAALSVASTILSVVNLITIRRLRIPSGG